MQPVPLPFSAYLPTELSNSVCRSKSKFRTSTLNCFLRSIRTYNLKEPAQFSLGIIVMGRHTNHPLAIRLFS